MSRAFTIRTDGEVVKLHTSNTAIKNNPIRGGVEILKWDFELNQPYRKQGDATLAGAKLDIWNRNSNAVRVNGKLCAPNTIVYTMTTNDDGYAGAANDFLPYGHYEIIESTPPTGFLNTGKIKQEFDIRENGVIVSLKTNAAVIKNHPIRGGVRVEKFDNEIDKNGAQGGATLAGAEFEIVNRSAESVLVGGVLYAPGAVVHTMATNAAGVAATANDLLPYGIYQIREIAPPDGYQPRGIMIRTFTIRTNGTIVNMNTPDTAIKNDPIRGDLKGIKISDGDHNRLVGVPFEIKSKTTGESHIIVTDQNGVLNTASEWTPHSQNTNRGKTDSDGIWFGDINTLDDGLGALLYDTYSITELPCDANKGLILLAFDVSIYRNNTILDLGTLVDPYYPRPAIFTSAIDRSTTDNVAYTSDYTSILDTVGYVELSPYEPYILKGVIMDKATGAPVLIDGEPITAKREFKTGKADGEGHANGTLSMEFLFDSRSLRGKEIVVFQSLEYQGVEIASHEDINAAAQTIQFLDPQISTSATGGGGGKALLPNPASVIVDTVTYDNLLTFHEYTLRGMLMDKATGKPLLVNGKTVTAEKKIKPKTSSGSTEMKFVLDATTLAGRSVVVFETLLEYDVEIAAHADINDEGQTVAFLDPSMNTIATGDNGGKELPVTEDSVIIDTVSYENLAPNEEYTLLGTLMGKASGESLTVEGKPVTAETTFTPPEPSGSITVEFSMNSTALAGREVVIFESLYHDGVELVTHADFENTDQTVAFLTPLIGTSAAGANGEKELYVTGETTIIDTVTYQSIAPNTEYTVRGILMDKETAEPLRVDGKEITAEKTFKPDLEIGSTGIEFSLNATALAGRSVVVFETLYLGDVELAAHADINDEEQTVTFKEPQISTSAAGTDGEKELFVSDKTKIVDTISYENLAPNAKYILRGALMNPVNGEPITAGGTPVTAETTFTPPEPSGSATVEFSINSSALAGRSVVVFETLYLGGAELAAHADINDEGQTVAFKEPSISTSATGTDGTKELPVAKQSIIMDTVTYNNLAPGTKHTLRGALMDMETEQPYTVNGQPITVEKTFTPTEPSGSVEMEFSLNTAAIEGRSAVVFETLYIDDVEIASHADITDKAQTVTFVAPTKVVTAAPQTGDGGLPVWTFVLIAGVAAAVILVVYRWRKGYMRR